LKEWSCTCMTASPMSMTSGEREMERNRRIAGKPRPAVIEDDALLGLASPR
jgi:hypothetical protein